MVCTAPPFLLLARSAGYIPPAWYFDDVSSWWALKKNSPQISSGLLPSLPKISTNSTKNLGKDTARSVDSLRVEGLLSAVPSWLSAAWKTKRKLQFLIRLNSTTRMCVHWSHHDLWCLRRNDVVEADCRAVLHKHVSEGLNVSLLTTIATFLDVYVSVVLGDEGWRMGQRLVLANNDSTLHLHQAI